MEVWPSFLPMWSSHEGNTELAVIRGDLPGHVDQRKISHRKFKTASVTLTLYGFQLPAFEHFIRDKCNEGIAPFVGSYRSNSGITSGVIRLEGGNFQVQKVTNEVHTVSATIEVLS